MGESGTPYRLTVQGGSWTAVPRSVDDTGDFRVTSGDGQRRVRVLEAMTRAWAGPPPSPRHMPHASGPLAPKTVSWVLPDYTCYPERIRSLTDPLYRFQSLPEQLARTAQAALWMHKARHGLQASVLPSRLGVPTGQIRSVLRPKSPPPVRASLVVLASDPIGARLALRDLSSTFGPISLADRSDPAETVTSRLRYLVLKIQEIRGLTQTALSKQLGTSQSWVSRLHRQVRPVLPGTLLAHLGRLGLGLRITVPVSGTVELGTPTLDISDHAGRVYVAYNSAQGLVKVGRTIRPIGKRLGEISRTTGSPGRYELVDARRTLRYRALEEALLEDLAPCAVQGEREYFDVHPSQAARRLREVAATLDEKNGDRC
jgi:transcriptional regulator with XRE-family HTH domain